MPRPNDAITGDGEAGRPRTLPSFWLLHAGGWLAYGAAMTLSRVGIFPLAFMVVAKGLLMVSGFVLSLALRSAYRPLIRRGTPLLTLIGVAVVSSYVVSMAWTAIDNLLAGPVYSAFGLRPPVYRSVVQLFNGTVYNAFTMLAWSVLYIGIRYYVALQAERERSLLAESAARHAQLEALRYQINPHFLFNSLNAVSTLVTERRNDEAARMLSRVSDFLRLTLAAPVRDEVALAEEIDYVRRYLEIERVRFGDRLRVEIDVGADAWEAAVPVFVLQPLVENAVRHAIAPRETGGSITVAASRAGDRVRISIVDDGPGLGNGSNGNGAGRIGLSNTRDRLRALYGEGGRLELANAPGGGTRATIEVPYARSQSDSNGTSGQHLDHSGHERRT
jgi:signal transduction histidine kinase